MPFNVHSLHDTLWLADPTFIQQSVSRLSLIPTCPTAREIATEHQRRLDEARHAATKAIRATKGKIGIIPVHGPIEQRLSAMSMKLGGTSTEEIGVAFDALVADPSIEAIVLHVDSGGGSSFGVQELSEKIYNARGRKRTYAIADSVAGSAAFWIATSAETMAVTPGGYVGSVGVYAAHVDESKALEAAGLKVTMVHAGKYKTEFAGHQPMSEEARSWLQEDVDRLYDAFQGALKRNRGVSLEQVRKDFGQGRIVAPEQALAARMIDRVLSFDDLLSKLTGSAAGGKKAAAAMDLLRLRHAHAKRKTDALLADCR